MEILESGTKKVQIWTKQKRYPKPTEKHRTAAKLMLMGYSEYAALRAVGYSHRVARKYRESNCLRLAIREAFLDQHRGPM